MTDLAERRFGNYMLKKIIGESSFTQVYLGRHIQHQRVVVIKVLDILLSKQETERFLEKAQSIMQLNHPHILRLMDVGVEGRTPYLVMNYMPRGTLRNRYPKGTRIPIDVIISYIKQIAGALQYIHDKSIVFQDLKPENFFVGDNEEILLSDFGIALLTQSARSLKIPEISVTHSYLAPEELEGKAIPESDQYALGVVVYEWLSGVCLFSGTGSRVARKEVLDSLRPLSQEFPEIPLLLEPVILRALADEPLERFNNVQEFANALEKAYLSEQTAAKISIKNPAIISTPSPRAIESQGGKEALKRIISRRRVVVSLRNTIGIIGIGSIIAGFLFEIRELQQPLLSPPYSEYFDTPTPIPQVILKPLYTYRGHSEAVESVAWSPDSKRIASASYDRTAQVWDANTGKPLYTYQGHSHAVYSVAWSPDSKRIASASDDRTVQVWRVT
jgi:eukaryotic-like serine/threonine-protein kinase